ncbi:DBF4-type zinc finger-containing protein 2 isoform X1 [Triplophysa dalaica]|uniref:DBF4-type zinc finger-containing protein 2 isoform X1 n=2 Tax=Triplophysa dalaica TaxID=1582913 RepID=UPI0024DFC54C|nr:DBF4-type zinc finger-containing protein 2 isoform X1 [Triplophysa dalaica]XP_056605683.1 DBF4-type zinc finger-containing protein 2 isoform X1 [Triplophysa dalaica]XP_056605684.1 DBF4-type zinc finger-containing protein 2 isoform X1 [Triplophysa dalaica]XP_056605685.1 DBF4-type zinc finger-containing protein 2 isoform X1 [Triplophysa dalaica]XP_056605686.1 DBF4-type zinc finger-containing protein 2 isoform X1 [Triplophysa dalaica]XP_056605687.1 DBF4-type zinc finger-containing protein 2 is
MPLEEGLKSFAKDAERRPAGTSGRGLEPIAGPSNSQRQGYCSCCQVLYNSVEQHILSAQHREVVRAARTNVSSGSLLERFLKDVLQHHPHRYSDTRPTHADLPSLTTPLVPKEEFSEVYCGSDDDGVSVGTREEMPTSDEESCQMLQIASASPPVTTDLPGTTHIQTTSQRRKKVPEPPPPEKYSPTQGFLQRTSGSSTNDQPHTSKTTQPIPNELSQTHPSEHISDSEDPPVTKTKVVEHRKAHRKTNRNTEGSDSSHAPPATKYITSKDQPATLNSMAKEPTVWISSVPPWKGPHREQTFSHLSDQIQDVIDEVIERYCYGRSPKVDLHEDDANFLLSPQSMSESKDSEEWDNAIQTALGKAKSEEKNLAELLKVHINLEDQEYQTQLDTALKTFVMSMKAGPEGTIESATEEVFPDLPHVPQSFIGKTWMQVMYEDDMKIDSIVKELQQGQVRCYFDSESLARYGKHCKKRGKNRKQDKTEQADTAGCEPTDILPLLEHHDEDLTHPVVLLKRTRQNIFRQASRCQVVKVSHGTQTIPLSCPVVRPKSTQERVPLPHSQEQGHILEKTPDMKTRLCALKLPASYCKIMSPLQPKTVVYVLSSPDGGQGISKPTPVKKVGRKRKSSDSDLGMKYKYKKTPVKFYDPLTNRILKSPPKGMSSLPNSISLSHVRQLFRSLSPDINKEKQDLEQGQSSGASRKGRGRSSMAELCTSTSGSCLEGGGPSEPGSSLSSRVLFPRSSISSSSCFLLGHLKPSASHTDDSPKALSQSCTGSSYKVGGSERKDHHKRSDGQTPIRRSSRRAGSLTPAKRTSAPPLRTKRKSTKPQSKAKSQATLQPKVNPRISAECRTSPRNKNPVRASLRSSTSKLAIQRVTTPSSKKIHTMLNASQQKRTRGRTATEHIAN